jgi:hypothetical protein
MDLNIAAVRVVLWMSVALSVCCSPGLNDPRAADQCLLGVVSVGLKTKNSPFVGCCQNQNLGEILLS